MTGASYRLFSIRRCAASRLTVFGDGSQTRSFCYVSDLVEGLLRLIESDEAISGKSGQSSRDDDSRIRGLHS